MAWEKPTHGSPGPHPALTVCFQAGHSAGAGEDHWTGLYVPLTPDKDTHTHTHRYDIQLDIRHKYPRA